MFLGRRRLGGLSRGRDYCLCACSVASPHETSAVLIDHRVRKEDFAFQVFQVGIIEVKAPLQGAIGHASLAFQEGDNLVEDSVECHDFYPPSSFPRTAPPVSPLCGLPYPVLQRVSSPWLAAQSTCTIHIHLVDIS